MIECAHRYLQGETNIHEVHGYAMQCKQMAHFFTNDSAIYEMASEWVTMCNRWWNEWGIEENPLTEEEFNEWLKGQLEIKD